MIGESIGEYSPSMHPWLWRGGPLWRGSAQSHSSFVPLGILIWDMAGGSKKGRKLSTEGKLRIAVGADKRERERALRRDASRHGEADLDTRSPEGSDTTCLPADRRE